MQEAPKRPQHLEMLDKANATRFARAEWRRSVRLGGDPLPVVRDNPAEFRTMYVVTALKCIPWMGSKRINAMLAGASILPTAKLGWLTEYQREELVFLLEERAERNKHERVLKEARARG